MRGLQQYKTTALETAPSETLLLLLIETVQDRLDQAYDAIEAGDKRGARAHMAFARSAFSEMIVSLDHEVAPAISAQLSRLYMWCIRELAKAGSEQSAERLDGVRKVTVTLLETWTEAIEGAP
jgi:flagellar biosynthetic protein FliS